MKLALIPAGEFMMGSLDANAHPGEKPEHKVRISASFYMGVTEVTQAQYEMMMGNNLSFFRANGGGKDKVRGEPCGENPVESVSWLDAIEFCNKLSEKEGLKPFYEVETVTARVSDWSGPGYRLPTEAEWEYACRANSRTRFSFGNDSARMDTYGWHQGNSEGMTHPVGKKRENASGLFDMHGNVCEWCWDGAGERYSQESMTIDPRGPNAGAVRIFRGGSWEYRSSDCTSTNRYSVGATGRYAVVGFRVARNQPPASELSNKSPSASEMPGALALNTGAPTNVPQPPQSSSAVKVPPARTADAAIDRSVAPGSPEAQLNARGLTRSGSYFVVASEVEALEKFRQIRPLINQLDAAFWKYAQVLEIESRVAVAEENHNGLRIAVDEANAVLLKMPNGRTDDSQKKQEYGEQKLYCDNLTGERDACGQLVGALRAQQPPPGLKEELAKAYTAKWSEFLNAAPPVAQVLEKAKEEHRKLQDDPAVQDAVAAIRRLTKAEVGISPVKNLQNAIDTIKKVRTYSPESAAPKRKPKAVKARSPEATAPKKKAKGKQSARSGT